MLRILIASAPGRKTEQIKADYSSGARDALKRYFNTEDIYHIRGSLFLEGRAYFTINNVQYLIIDKH